MSSRDEYAAPRDDLAIYRLLDQLSDELGEAVSASQSARSGSERRIAKMRVEWVQDIMIRLAQANYQALTAAGRQRHDDAIDEYAGGAFADYVGLDSEGTSLTGFDTGREPAPEEESAEGEKLAVTHAFMCQSVAAGYLGWTKDPSGVARYSLAARGAAFLTKHRMTSN